MQREIIASRLFDANAIDNRAEFPVPRGVGARISIVPLDTITSLSLDVLARVGGAFVAFDTPKALTDAARSAQITTAEMTGADAIVVRVDTAAGGSGVKLVNVFFTVDQDEGT